MDALGVFPTLVHSGTFHALSLVSKVVYHYVLVMTQHVVINVLKTMA